MAMIRRHWFSGLLWGVVMVGALSAWLMPMLLGFDGQQAAQAQEAKDPAAPAMDPVVYSHLAALRENLALRSSDLAALRVSQE